MEPKPRPEQAEPTELALTEIRSRSSFFIYNPYEKRTVEVPLTNCDAVISLLKCVIGTGILAMPLAFRHSGVLGGVLFSVLLMILLTYSIHLLVYRRHDRVLSQAPSAAGVHAGGRADCLRAGAQVGAPLRPHRRPPDRLCPGLRPVRAVHRLPGVRGQELQGDRRLLRRQVQRALLRPGRVPAPAAPLPDPASQVPGAPQLGLQLPALRGLCLHHVLPLQRAARSPRAPADHMPQRVAGLLRHRLLLPDSRGLDAGCGGEHGPAPELSGDVRCSECLRLLHPPLQHILRHHGLLAVRRDRGGQHNPEHTAE
ncbi:uncharacterized protein polyph isoform X4 [Drosophila pseudoobscura]|uniref:Uncharacterized protein polyph isoform X4 n=1 Tax=Drosophila pseudoobscura pseudoobscura TaxID=46245 RepID=A0A6I8VGD7_DROPS|nr:uncharacterized protein LOC4805658 isoform X4 [Drosophila pseudoobscura]